MNLAKGNNLLTPSEVCDLLNIERSYLYRLQNEKKFPCIKLGSKTLRYDKRAIEKWLLKSQQGLWIE
ncbi:MAG: helix-turn-helix domain-containing protein [Candidatus Marinimicrobia bacterium]|nr:helix-turn-helix domain-containing protein [Candidatus Neomarinimicrobiota bacterium]